MELKTSDDDNFNPTSMGVKSMERYPQLDNEKEFSFIGTPNIDIVFCDAENR